MTGIEKVLAALKGASLDFDIARFDHRLIAQKLVYLLEELGVRLGYEGTYNFYLRGTYSPRLTKDLFESTGAKVSKAASKLRATERKAITSLAESTKLRPHILEVMAAYRFLRNEGRSKEESIRLIKTQKPFISPRDVAIGVSKCKTFWSEVTEEDIRSMKEEMGPWERASDQDAL